MACLSALTRYQKGDYRSEDDCNSDKNYDVGVLGEERKDLTSIGGAKKSKKGVADETPDSHCHQEFRYGILHSSRGDNERNERKRRRQ